MTESMAVANALVCIRDAESDKEEEPGVSVDTCLHVNSMSIMDFN